MDSLKLNSSGSGLVDKGLKIFESLYNDTTYLNTI